MMYALYTLIDIWALLMWIVRRFAKQGFLRMVLTSPVPCQSVLS